LRELKAKNPLVDLRIFANRNFLICTILVFIWGIIIFATQYILPVFIARTRGLDGTTIASMVYIMGAAQVASGFLALFLFKIVNRRTVAFIGFIMLATGTWLQGFMISETGLNEIIWPQIIRGLSAQLCFLPLVLLSIGYLPADKIKDGSGLYSLMNRLGAAIGIAASNTLFELKITENYLEISNITSKALNHSQLFLMKLNSLIPKYLSNSPEKIKIVSEILYKIGIEEASAMAFNQIMLTMGIMALIISPLIFLVKGLKKE